MVQNLKTRKKIAILLSHQRHLYDLSIFRMEQIRKNVEETEQHVQRAIRLQQLAGTLKAIRSTNPPNNNLCPHFTYLYSSHAMLQQQITSNQMKETIKIIIFLKQNPTLAAPT